MKNIFILVCILVIFSGCTKKEEQKVFSKNTVMITNGGRTFEVASVPERVVCFSSYCTENLLVLGLGDKVVGTFPLTQGNFPIAGYEDAFHAIAILPDRSHEAALGFEPDFVSGQVGSFSDKAWGSIEMFTSKGIAVYINSGTLTDDETIDNIYEDFENLGKIFKVESKAAAVVSGMKSKVEKVTAKTKNIDKRVKVFVMDANKGNEIYTTAKGLQNNIIELAGGNNVTKNAVDKRWFNTSIETIIDTNPDVIIFNNYGSQKVEDKISFIMNNPALADVAAVVNKNYIVIPLQNVMQNVRAADTVEIFAKHFYPEFFN